MVADGEVEFFVDSLAVLGVGVAQDLDDALELADEVLDLVGAESGAVGAWSECHLGSLAGELDLVDPLADDRRVGAGFEGLAVLGELVVAFLELLAGRGDAVLFGDVGPGSLFEGGAGVVDVWLFGFQRGVMVSRSAQLGLPA